jgi:hypothetical protein
VQNFFKLTRPDNICSARVNNGITLGSARRQDLIYRLLGQGWDLQVT